ncbi:hypothetical protein [Geobacter sp. SVR]
MLSYLKCAGLKRALLLNFGEMRLQTVLRDSLCVLCGEKVLTCSNG